MVSNQQPKSDTCSFRRATSPSHPSRMLPDTPSRAPIRQFQYPPNAKHAPATRLRASVNRLTMFGVMGVLISCRLIGIDTRRFIRAKMPSVDFTNHRSSFRSAAKQSSERVMACQDSLRQPLGKGTDLCHACPSFR